MKAGVYHGDDSLSCIGNTRVSDQKTVAPAWNEFMVFETALRDLPRNARLCFVIYGVIDASSKGYGKHLCSLVNFNPVLLTCLSAYSFCLCVSTKLTI